MENNDNLYMVNKPSAIYGQPLNFEKVYTSQGLSESQALTLPGT